MHKKWYSHGLTYEKTIGLEKSLALIESPNAGLDTLGRFQVRFTLQYLSQNNEFIKDPRREYCELYGDDIAFVLRGTHTSEISQLSNKIVETYSNNHHLISISTSHIHQEDYSKK